MKVDISNGFIQTPNSYEDIMARVKMNGTQQNIMHFIVRKVWGFKYDTRPLSLEYIANGTGITKGQIQRELTKLIERNILMVAKEHGNNSSREIGINEDYDSWIGVREIRGWMPELENTEIETEEIRVRELENPKAHELENSGVCELENQLNKHLNKNINISTKSVLEGGEEMTVIFLAPSEEEKKRFIENLSKGSKRAQERKKAMGLL